MTPINLWCTSCTWHRDDMTDPTYAAELAAKHENLYYMHRVRGLSA